MTRIGLFGGSFNPVHNGHLVMAHELREAAGLDEVRLIPLNLPPHKSADALLPGAHRLQLLHLACEGQSGLVVDDRELQRRGVSWSIDTVREYLTERPSDDLYLLIGHDSLPDLPQWKEASELARLVIILVASRPGFDAGTVQDPALRQFRIRFVPTTPVGISSTVVRARARAGFSLGGYVPVPVADLIRNQRWYMA